MSNVIIKDKPTAAAIGFVNTSDIQQAIKPVLLLPALAGVYVALTSVNPVKKGAGVAVAVLSLVLFATIDSSITDDNEAFKDTINDESAVNQDIVNVFVNRFKIGLASWTGCDCCGLFKEYFELDQANFIAVANKYKNLTKKTLRNDINNAWYACFSDYKPSIIQRMNELKIA